MKKLILISILVLGGMFIGSSSMPTTEMSAPRCRAWAVRCPNCGWSSAYPGCTWSDPYPPYVKCSRCNWYNMFHVSQPCDGLCE